MARIANLIRRVTHSRLLRPPRSVIFFAFFYVYFVFEIDSRLFYHCCGLIDNFPAFYQGWDFFGRFLDYPGGLLQYLSAFLSQLFFYSWAGAAVVTGQVGLMCLATDCIINRLGASRWRGLRFVGPLLVLIMYSQYSFAFPTTMGFLVALLAVCLYLRLRSEKLLPNLGVFVAISLVLYVAAGGPFLLFAGLAALYELFFGRRLCIASACLAAGVVIPYVVGGAVYSQRPLDAYFELTPLSWKVVDAHTLPIMRKALYGLYLFLPSAIAVLGIWRLFSSRPVVGSGRTESNNQPANAQGPRWTFWGDNRGVFGLNLSTLVLIGVTLAVLTQFRDTRLRTLFRVDHYSQEQRWSRVIDIGRRNPYHYLVCHAVNRALYHTDRLADEMFSFPQHSNSLLLTGRESLWHKFDTCIDLGLLNEAENALTISMEMFGERPLLLERLAWVNMAKGNVGAARALLGALSKVPFWTAQAREHLARLDADPNLTDDPEIQQLRAMMLRTDFVRGGGDSLTGLLNDNSGNRMAYEYYLARLLFAREADAFLKVFDAFHRADDSDIPRHHQEALALFRAIKQQPLDVPGQFITTTIKTQLREFLQVITKHGRNTAAARAALEPTYGDTYFYYFFFGGEGGL